MQELRDETLDCRGCFRFQFVLIKGVVQYGLFGFTTHERQQIHYVVHSYGFIHHRLLLLVLFLGRHLFFKVFVIEHALLP